MTSGSEPINREAVVIYLDGAREALRNAHYNLDGNFFGPCVSRAYYAFFYAATALLLTLDLARNKQSGVLSAFREHFVKPGLFPTQDSDAYGKAFELRNVTDYEMVGKADEAQARIAVENARGFVDRCETYLSGKGYL
jgi:uncharacterized protein (UPF0332 family)